MSRNLLEIDWSTIPAPIDDGLADHLLGMQIPDMELMATDKKMVKISKLFGTTIIYAYPRTGVPGQSPLFEDWDLIPGARGCTPQSCAFRDHFIELKNLGINNVFGLSTQDSAYQQEAVARLHLPFNLLSDEHFGLTNALKLPTFSKNGITLLKRITLVIRSGEIIKCFYPIFPPDQNATEVINWLINREG